MNILGNLHVVGGLAPVDTASTVTEAFSDVVDAGECAEIEFQLYIGTLTGGVCVVIPYSDANTTGGGGTAIPFRYKLSAATGTDISADWVYCAATGYSVADASEGMILRVNVDPANCTNALPYCYIGMDPGSGVTVFVHSVTIVVVPRYNQGTPPSIVD